MTEVQDDSDKWKEKLGKLTTVARRHLKEVERKLPQKTRKKEEI